MKKKISVFTIVVGYLFLTSGSAVSSISISDARLFTEKFYNSSPSYVYQFDVSNTFDSDDKPLTVTASDNSHTYTLKTDDPSLAHSIAGYYYGSDVIDPLTPLNQLTMTAKNSIDTVSVTTNLLATSDQKILGEAKNLISAFGTNPLTPTITWSPVTDADNYIVRLYDNPNLPNIKSWYLGSDPTFSIEEGFLEFGKNYTLRVTANDKQGGNGPVINRSSTYIPFNYGNIQISQSETLINNTTLLNSSQIQNEGTIAGEGTYLQTDGQTINNGTMLQDSIKVQKGSFVANGTITVSDTFYNYGVLTGAGNINGNVINNGSVSPGASPGTLSIVGEYSQGISGTLVIEIGGYFQGTEYDWLNITGTANLAGQLDVFLYNGFIPKIGDTFTFLTTTNGIIGEFNSYNWPTGLHSWFVDYSDFKSVKLTYQGNDPVPEPTTMILFGTGLAGLAAARRREKSVDFSVLSILQN